MIIIERIIFDTDIGTDIDDSFALAYLLARRDCEIEGVTTVSGEAEKRAELVSAILHNAGREDIPVFPGCNVPLMHEEVQPKAKQYSQISGFEHQTDFEKYSAVEFMRHKIRANPCEITLLAVGALTNVALLFKTDPEIPSLLKRLVIMGAHFGFEDERTSEWNMKCDRHAAKIVFDNAPEDFLIVSADVTRKISMSKEEHEKYLDIPLLKPVFAFAQNWYTYSNNIFYHDPLAAALIFKPDLCTYVRGKATVENVENGPVLNSFEPCENGGAVITRTVDVDAFLKHYYSVF